jgi:nicotinamidase-related amidase
VSHGPAKGGGLADPLGPDCIHLCIDMQRLFGSGSPWEVPWMATVLPRIADIARRHAARTVFTRFVPAERAEDAPGTWGRYYRKWSNVTLQQIDRGMVDLMPDLARLVPPAKVVDKRVYSPWTEGALDDLLRGTGVITLIVTGGETDVCVLATVLGAVDRGFRVVLVADALCSADDRTHDALMQLYCERFSEQIEVATTEAVLSAWPPG